MEYQLAPNHDLNKGFRFKDGMYRCKSTNPPYMHCTYVIRLASSRGLWDVWLRRTKGKATHTDAKHTNPPPSPDQNPHTRTRPGIPEHSFQALKNTNFWNHIHTHTHIAVLPYLKEAVNESFPAKNLAVRGHIVACLQTYMGTFSKAIGIKTPLHVVCVCMCIFFYSTA